MLNDYSKFSDILLIDTTYNTNFYSIPLVVFCGVNNNYQNVLFGLALINDETIATYRWVLRNFLELTQINPQLVITDNDHALKSAIREEFAGVPHRLCGWHVARSLRRNLNFISSEHKGIKDKIFGLPYVDDQETFDKYQEEIIKFLTDHNYAKSLEYLKDLLNYKHQWAKAYYPLIFDGGISTTSRVESLNAEIKRYLNSKSEVSDIIEFITRSEKCEYLDKSLNKDISRCIEIDPLLDELSAYLPSRIMLMQFEQYSLSKKYSNKPFPGQNGQEIYEVKYDPKKAKTIALVPVPVAEAEAKTYRTHQVTSGSKLACSCDFYFRTGLVCRHILHICAIKNEKTMEKLLIADRWRRSLLINTDTHFKVINAKKKESEEKREIRMEIIPENAHILSSEDEITEEIQEEKPLEKDKEEEFEERKARGMASRTDTSNFEKKTNPKGAPKGKMAMI